VDAFAAVSTGRLSDLRGADPNVRMTEDVLRPDIPHWLYRGDTPLHLAAAMLATDAASALLAAGGDANALNRRRAAPLHYACDPRPGGTTWNPGAQQSMIELLVSAGALVNAADMDGVTALHRAVRARSPRAVETLLRLGADRQLKTRRGAIPLDLTRSSAGAGGTAHTADERRKIIALLSTPPPSTTPPSTTPPSTTQQS
jgi:ankyrin repeat protein